VPYAVSPRNDRVFVSCDQAGLQDRAFAHYLAEFDGGTYARAFLSGLDPHWATAKSLMLAPATATVRDKENKLHTALREGCKSWRYGFLFGMRALRAGTILCNTIKAGEAADPTCGLMTQFFGASTHPGENALKRSGQRALDRFIAATPGLGQLREHLQSQVKNNEWLLGLDGRRVPVDAQYKALNYAVTSAEAVICKRWLINVYDELCARFRYGWGDDDDDGGDAVIVAWVHDELVVCCRPEIADQVGEIMVHYARESGEYYGFKLPLDAEYSVGHTWAGEGSAQRPASITFVSKLKPAPDEKPSPRVVAADPAVTRSSDHSPAGNGRDCTSTAAAESAAAATIVDWLSEREHLRREQQERAAEREQAEAVEAAAAAAASMHSEKVHAGNDDGSANGQGFSSEPPSPPPPTPPPPPGGSVPEDEKPESSSGKVTDAASDDDAQKPAGGPQQQQQYPYFASSRPDDPKGPYLYETADREFYLAVDRKYKPNGDKYFPQWRWEDGQRVNNVRGPPKIPYRLPELLAAPNHLWVLICAGEKDVITAVRLDFVATTNSGGEIPNAWTPDLNQWFAGKLHVAIMEDRDKTGEAHVIEVAKALLGIVPDIRIIRFPEFPENSHADLTDWIEAVDPEHHRRGYAELLTRIEAAKPVTAADFPTAAAANNTDEPFHSDVAHDGTYAGQGDPGEDTPAEKIRLALAVIPPTSREDRIKYGHALYRWSRGSGEGFSLFTGWLRLPNGDGKQWWPGFIEANARRAWAGFKEDSPPEKIATIASIFRRANQEDPTWRDRWGEFEYAALKAQCAQAGFAEPGEGNDGLGGKGTDNDAPSGGAKENIGKGGNAAAGNGGNGQGGNGAGNGAGGNGGKSGGGGGGAGPQPSSDPKRAPYPLPDSLLPVAQFDFDLLPEGLRAWGEDIYKRMQCPPDFVGITMMTALGGVIGRKVAIRPQCNNDWQEIPNQWAAHRPARGLEKPADGRGIADVVQIGSARA
jgi:hypothetical protein